MLTYMGLHVIPDANLVDHCEDWSQVRSPARAKRRMARTHRHKTFPQRVRYYTNPSTRMMVIHGHTVVMHPEMYKNLELEMNKNASSNPGIPLR